VGENGADSRLLFEIVSFLESDHDEVTGLAIKLGLKWDGTKGSRGKAFI
jgi:hypothetical protein